MVDNKAVIKIDKVVTYALPLVPKNLPNKAATKKDNKGINNINKYITLKASFEAHFLSWLAGPKKASKRNIK